ncbi:uncharacterized protein LOC125054722 [Pieris napi]|uniref:uncharacterized protein LOC125054722 n=1 Tax=Pieris napi TaxID=78633 RepID=UPI001FBA9927|nr:uncharacterized protein LOC125054722 [Pieris napi]
MKNFVFCVLILTYLAVIKSSIYSHLKENVLPYIAKDRAYKDNFLQKYNNKDVKVDRGKPEVYKIQKNRNDQRIIKPVNIKDLNTDKQVYRIDPVLNIIKSNLDGRRKFIDDTSSLSSSSVEGKNWKEEWKEHWLLKKLEAVNSSIPKGDMVNMVAARPWGVPCGDPNQHDFPWGSCMLPMECESEYRIYRGDYFCGRSNFVCCALQMTTYDLYTGFDVSFEDSDLATDTDEKRNRNRGSKEKRRRKKRREQKRRRRERLKRKRKIKRDIRKIIREITKILNRSFRNGTTERKRKTKQLKKFIKEMKKKYKKDRRAVKDIHEMEMIKVDAALQKRLNEIRGMNEEYVKNSTFRDIIINGTISKKNVRLLMNAYPELQQLLHTRRSGRPPDYLEYDIEYGLLYY